MNTLSAHQNKRYHSAARPLATAPHHQVTTHFTKIQNMLTYASHLSDGAYRTYVVLISYDYQDSATRRYKGTVTLSIEELCKLRGKGRSTLYSHLQELTEAGLIALTPDGIQLYQVEEEKDDATRGERRLVDNESEVAVQISGHAIEELEEDKKQKQIQYPEAENDVVVLKLIKLGFDAYLARSFVSRYGPERVDRQVTNLCCAMRRGQVVRSFPRWLYTAIERDYGADSRQDEHRPQRHRYSEVAIDEHSRMVTIVEEARVVYAD